MALWRTGTFLRNVNMVVAANSERFIIARDEPLLRSVVRKANWTSGYRDKASG